MKDKILFIAYDVNPELGSECGVAHSYLNIYSKYYDIDVYTGQRHEEDIVNFDYGPNVSFHYIDFSRFDKYFGKYQLYFISNWFFCKEIYKTLIHKNNDVYTFMHIITPEGVFSFNRLYKLNVKYIIGPVNGGLKSPKNFDKVFQNEYFYDFIRNFIYKSITKLPVWIKYYEKATVIINSDHNVLKLIPKKFHSKTSQIFDTLVNPDVFMVNPSKNEHQNSINILFCGRLIPKKGILILLESFRRCVVNHHVENITLTISGRGPLYNEILKFIELHKLSDKITVHNGLQRALLIKKYQEADIFCAPTLREPGGTAILEAMSCGLPIITSNYGGPSYSVTPDCGIKIELSTYENYVDDLTKSIVHLYQNQTTRKVMGENSRKRILDEFSIQSVEKKMSAIWEKI